MQLNIRPTWKNISIFTVILLLIDQVSKIVIKLTMTIGETIYVFGTWFQIKFIENPGAAYGFEISEGTWGKLSLSIIRILAITAFIYYLNLLKNRRAPRGVIFGFALIIAGAIGNLLDSMFYGLIFSHSTYFTTADVVPFGEGYAPFLQGWVVDMLYFPIIKTTLPSWIPIYGGEPYIFFSPIFNIADSYISIGFIYLLIFQRKFFSKQ